MIRIPPTGDGNYEPVAVEEWINGTLTDIEFEANHNSGFADQESGEPIIYDAVKLSFTLEGYEKPHKTNWMRISMNEKSNLFKKYLSALVDNLDPKREFDLERLKGMKVKLMYANNPKNPKFQNIELIRAVDKKVDGSIPF